MVKHKSQIKFIQKHRNISLNNPFLIIIILILIIIIITIIIQYWKQYFKVILLWCGLSVFVAR